MTPDRRELHAATYTVTIAGADGSFSSGSEERFTGCKSVTWYSEGPAVVFRAPGDLAGKDHVFVGRAFRIEEEAA